MNGTTGVISLNGRKAVGEDDVVYSLVLNNELFDMNEQLFAEPQEHNDERIGGGKGRKIFH